MSHEGDLPPQFTFPFCYTPHPLALQAAREVERHLVAEPSWQEEIARGKMFGVLVCQRADGQLGFVAAFSGQLQGRSCLPWFVPPVFDILAPGSRFVEGEQELNRLNRRVAELERSPRLRRLRQEVADMQAQAEADTARFRSQVAAEKAAAPEAERVARAQHLNAELRRLRLRWAERVDAKRRELHDATAELEQLKAERRRQSDSLQDWIFRQYRMLNARGEERHLVDIFAHTVQRVPPSGAGECCAPKLLQYAYREGLRPVCMAEFWWGASPREEVRHHRSFYPACQGKCQPILAHMLQGLDVEPDPQAWQRHDLEERLRVVYEDEWLCVVDKPSGLLSVPGRHGCPSVEELLGRRGYARCVHRLDQDTSGLMVVARSEDVCRKMQRQFACREVEKEYVAVVEGVPAHAEGIVSLPLSPDYMHRPCQRVDHEHGRQAVTIYKVLGSDGNRTRLQLLPQTGRTHQLRIHCAHADGLSCPIVGDRLYGHGAALSGLPGSDVGLCSNAPSAQDTAAQPVGSGTRLMLHACRLQFAHPVTGQRMTLTAPCEDFF